MWGALRRKCMRASGTGWDRHHELAWWDGHLTQGATWQVRLGRGSLGCTSVRADSRSVFPARTQRLCVP